jgi:hypothetical protein
MENKLNKIKMVLKTILSSIQRENHNPNGLTLSEFDCFFNTYAQEFTKTLVNNGKAYTLKLFKELHNQSVRLVTKEPWSPIPFHKADKEGISTLLLPMLKHLRGDRYKDIRIILSVTRLHESIRLKPELDLNPIVTPYSGTEDLGEFEVKFLKFLQESRTSRKLHLGLPKLKGSQELIGRIRSGPNGQAIVTAHYDARAVCEDNILLQSMNKFNELLSQSHITQNMIWCRNESLNLPIERKNTGKLSLAAERAGKTRLFAIGDYWSQNSLQSLHDWLMKILKSLPCDGTYDQHSAFERILGKKVRFMASFDITKFTCRVPLRLQTIMLGYYTSHDLAQCWEGIVGNRTFRAPDKTEVTWCVGQPLGLLSSWAACTLLHHHLVWYASYIHFNDHRTFKGYQVLGDDIVIWHKGVAKAYANLLKELGIEINISKSKLYNKKKEKSPIFEFAKRLAVSNNEISGIPYDLLQVSSTSIYNYVDLVQYLVDTKLLLVSRELAPPEYLTPKGQYFLEILLWERSLGRPSWLENRLGNVFEETSLLNELRRQVAKVRIQGFQELLGRLDELCYSSDLEKELKRAGVEYSDTLIGYGSNFYHPIVHALNSVGMKMYEVLPILEDIESASGQRELSLPELTSIEYLPLPYMSAHFERPGKRNPERLRKHSQLVLTATKQLKASPFGFVLLNEPEPKDKLPG